VKLNIPKRKTILLTTLGIIVGLLVATIYYSFAAGSNDTFTISQGIYPGAPSYTIWKQDATYYAKNNFGVVKQYGTNKTTVIVSAIADLTDGGLIVLSDITMPNGITIPEYVKIIEHYKGVTKMFLSDVSWRDAPNHQIVSFKAEYNWTDLDAEQGVCTDGTYLYVSETERLGKWTKAGTRLYDVDPFNGDSDLDHCGDICYYNGYVYASCSNYFTNPDVDDSTLRYVYKYDASDLSYVTRYNMSTEGQSGIAEGIEASGIGYWNSTVDSAFVGFWLITYEEINCSIYHYNIAFTYQNRKVQLQDLCLAQGIAFHPTNGQQFWVTAAQSSNGYENTGTDLHEFCGFHRVRSQIVIPFEGFDVDPNLEYLWICKAHTGGDDPLCQMYFHP